MCRLSRLPLVVLAVLGVLGLCWPRAGGAMFQWVRNGGDADNQAIAYSTTAPSDAIARLQRALDAGATELQFDAKNGYLKSVLRELEVPVTSQTLVFSRTSSQHELISPARPRALYFNRDVHVGWVAGGQVLEVASVDPKLGAVFYTLRQEQSAHPRFERQTRACLQCHDSPSLTAGVPGLIVKSVYTDKDGEPIASAGSYVTSDRSPLRERWGGWYVTGTHGGQVHMGNLIAESTPGGARLNLAAGANVTDLRTRIDTQPYLTDHSDIVALMVLEHQSSVHNLITRLSYRTRMALYFDEMRNRELGRSRDYVPDTTVNLIKNVGEPLVQAMLFAGEAPLTEPVAGTSGFSSEFASDAPRDRMGRSLVDLDLARRLFRYPCSYLIYSESFDALPIPAKDYVYRRLWEVLSGDDTSSAFAQLSRADRTAIWDILLETKPDFAAWRAAHIVR